jgi:hypothetical protein
MITSYLSGVEDQMWRKQIVISRMGKLIVHKNILIMEREVGVECP